MTGALVVVVGLAILVMFVISRTAVVVPQQSAFVVERLGKFHGTLDAGFHILLPFIDAIRYRLTLKEEAIDIPEQVCITRDNVQVHVDGVIFLKVLNAERASYGIGNYLFAISQLAQTTLRSEIGKIELDRTFEERSHINIQVVNELDKATEPWGIKVLRYEIKNITPPVDVLAAMEKQMRAEREKRATILTSEGQRDAAINNAEGEKQQVIKASEANKQQQINEAEGGAAAIRAIAEATAEGIRRVAEAIQTPGGQEAVRLRVAEQYVTQFGAHREGEQHAGVAGERLGRRCDDRAGDERDRAQLAPGNAVGVAPVEERVGTLRRGTLAGAGFGLAVAGVDAWLRVGQVLGGGTAPSLVAMIRSALLVVALGTVMGAFYAQLLVITRGWRWHLFAIAFTWATLALYTASADPLERLAALIGPAVGALLAALGGDLGRRRPWLPAILGTAFVAAAMIVTGAAAPR